MARSVIGAACNRQRIIDKAIRQLCVIHFRAQIRPRSAVHIPVRRIQIGHIQVARAVIMPSGTARHGPGHIDFVSMDVDAIGIHFVELVCRFAAVDNGDRS
ncbi:hypothetical protein D3C81_1846920 [compost metagenome]